MYRNFTCSRIHSFVKTESEVTACIRTKELNKDKTKATNELSIMSINIIIFLLSNQFNVMVDI